MINLNSNHWLHLCDYYPAIAQLLHQKVPKLYFQNHKINRSNLTFDRLLDYSIYIDELCMKPSVSEPKKQQRIEIFCHPTIQF